MTPLSNCCQKPVNVITSGKPVGTSHYECSVCKQHCDLDPSYEYDPVGGWILGLVILGSVVLGISLLVAEGGL